MRTAAVGSESAAPCVAFSVGRPVGNAVVRNRVRRRLRSAVREQAALLAPGSAYLVRVSPAAASESYSELSDTLRAILGDLSAAAP